VCRIAVFPTELLDLVHMHTHETWGDRWQTTGRQMGRLIDQAPALWVGLVKILLDSFYILGSCPGQNIPGMPGMTGNYLFARP
jgi:hypothetical protein